MKDQTIIYEQKKLLSNEELEEILIKLEKWDALELQEDSARKEVYIPYVMNDAVECYLRFAGCVIHGIFENECMEGTQSDVVEDGKSKGLILRQSSGNTVSIWYQEVYLELHCYQYHLIGHSWRKKRGEEDIRRLVNLICVLHDKINYLFADDGIVEAYGDTCIEKERKMGKLAEFAPILFYTPINESILEWYPQSLEGIQEAKELALEAGDQGYYEEILKYEVVFQKGKVKEKQIRQMAEHLLQPQHRKIWQLINEKIKTASMHWPVRDYGVDKNQMLEQRRSELQKKYRELGFEGEYPYMEKREQGQKVEFVEEQAFTVMEAEDFHHRIFVMLYLQNDVLEIWKEEAVI